MTTFVPVRFNANVRVAAVLLASLSVNPAVGQDNARSNPIHLPTMAYKEEKPHPPQMEKLIVALAGEWTTEDAYEVSDQMPTKRREHSRESYRVGPARGSLIEEYHGEDAPGKPWGTGIFWWDDGAKGVHVLWCDSEAIDMGCRVLSEVGKWEGKEFVQTDLHDESGKRIFAREVWSDLKRDSFTQTVYQGVAADKLRKILTIKATRVQPRVHP